MADPTEPTEPMPSTPGPDPSPGSTPPPPPPTTEMPAAEAGAAAAAAGAAGGASVPPVPPPPGDGLEYAIDGDDAENKPWWKKAGPLAAVIIVAALVIGGLVWLLWGGSDDSDDDSDLSASVVIRAVDQSGAGLQRGFFAAVTGPADAPTDYTWSSPQSGPGTDGVGGTTNSDGELTFTWAPNDTLGDPSAWTSTFEMVETENAGFSPPGPTVDCVLGRPDEQNSTISMTVSVDPPDASVDQVVSYTFPNHQFLPGDRVTCELVSQEIPTTTTTSTTTTEATTTTTVPDTTTTQATTTTTDSTTTTTDSTTTTTEAGLITAWETLNGRSDTTAFVGLLEGGGQDDLIAVLQDPDTPVTVFAPDNDAVAAADAAEEIPTDQAELNQWLSRQILQGQALTEAQVLAQATLTIDGVTYAIDGATIGGAAFVDSDQGDVNGYVQVMDAVISADS